MESTTGYTFITYAERQRQSGVKEIAKVSKRPQWDSNPWPLDRHSGAVTAEPSHLTVLYGLVETII